MVRWRLKEQAQPDRWTARKLSIATGMSYNSIWAIWSGKAKRADLETLDKLCEVLSLEPGDLFERITTETMATTTPDHAV